MLEYWNIGKRECWEFLNVAMLAYWIMEYVHYQNIEYAVTGMLECSSTGDTQYSSFGMLEYPRNTNITLS